MRCGGQRACNPASLVLPHDVQLVHVQAKAASGTRISMLADPAGDMTEKRMSNVFKFDPNAIRERRRLNEKSQQRSAKEAESMQARKDSRRAWLLFVGAAILLTILNAILPLG